MSETEALFSVLRQSADPDAVAAIEALVRDGPDHALCRINVIDFAKRANIDEELAIAAFLHAARLGIFDLLEHAVSGMRWRARRQQHAEIIRSRQV